MCGIAAIFNTSPEKSVSAVTADRIISSLRHRGPDGTGQKYFQNANHHISLFHSRLAIIDPLPRSDQPFTDHYGNTIVFNGEIYNYKALAESLAEPSDHPDTQSDTEVLLQLYRKYGSEMVHHLRGMYAFVIWDEQRQQAFAARDDFGIKPLYLARYGSVTIFASEVSAILASDLIPRELSEPGVAAFFRWGSCQGNALPLKHISRIEQGTSLLWKKGEISSGPECTPWNEAPGSEEDVATTFRSAFLDSVQSHLVSDVPVATFLSSGIDSAAIIAAAHIAGADPIPSFTLSFPGREVDEAAQARELARTFHSPHTSIEMPEDELAETFDHYIASQDLPGIDGFNTFCISRATAAHGFKVALSGLGGDELLGGYPSFRQVPRLINLHQMTRWASGFFSLPAMTELTQSQRRLARTIEFLNSSGSIGEAYETSRCLFSSLEVINILKQLKLFTQPSHCHPANEYTELKLTEQISILEAQQYLNHQLLRDTDNYSMSHGLEIRVPFIDRLLWKAVTGFAPQSRFEPCKYLIQRAFPELPEILFEQKKRGFGLPWNVWIRGPLREQFNGPHSLPLHYEPTWFQSLSLVSFLAWCQRHQIDLPDNFKRSVK
jgi:asparagine synthase (glutamine-hydrolysing)